METSPTQVTSQKLEDILRFGANKVVGVYSDFRRVFFERQMMEVGLTDLFILGAQSRANDRYLDFLLEWGTKESETGYDFWATTNNNLQLPSYQGPKHRIYFQAKVAKQHKINIGQGLSKTELYAEFLFMSTKKENGIIYMNYQLALLVSWANENKGEAYYVVYDSDRVYWFNAQHLLLFFFLTPELPGDGSGDVAWCRRAWKALCKNTFSEARDLVYRPRPENLAN
ncbi:hypothetical protein PM082_000811 [Marasmius tenuissimus]|nr:hypothetical protein PM082_000811 [Marasmius tenuissimus]